MAHNIRDCKGQPYFYELFKQGDGTYQARVYRRGEPAVLIVKESELEDVAACEIFVTSVIEEEFS